MRKEVAIERHKKISTILARSMFALLAYALFCSVTALGSDIAFIDPSRGIELPVLGVEVDLATFFLLGPAGLLAIHSYARLHLLHLRRLPEIPEEERLPTLFNYSDLFSMILAHATFFWLTPLVLWLFAWKSLPGDGDISGVLILLATIVTLFTLLCPFWAAANEWRKKKGKSRIWLIVVVALPVVSVVLVTLTASMVLIFTWDRSFNLKRADLRNMDLRSYSFPCADLEFASLAGADLRRVSLHRANLRGANLEGTKLNNAILLDANLKDAEMAKADLTDTDLRAAKMEETRGLTQEQLNRACQSKSERIAEGFIDLVFYSSCRGRLLLPDLSLPRELTAPSRTCVSAQ